MGKSYRIKDIALLSGVSTGTVDRILHHRGKVSAEAQQKVEKVLKEIDYHPNMIARSLALKKPYRLIALIPKYESGSYWDKVNQGIEKAKKEFFNYPIEIEQYCFDQYDQESFDALLPEIMPRNYQGFIISTQFQERVRKLCMDLDQRNIPYVFIDDYINNTNCLAFYGTHSFESGYLAGRLLYEQIKPTDSIALFRIIQKKEDPENNRSQRENGFRDYLHKNKYNGRIIPIHLYSKEMEKNEHILESFCHEHPEIVTGVIFNSKAHAISSFFHRKSWIFKLIGYDAIDANIEHLQNGDITHLIGQRPESQGFYSVRALFRYLLFEEIPERVNYMPIDILVKENIQFYKNYL